MFAPEFIVPDGTLVTSEKKVKYTPNPFKLWSPNLDLSANILKSSWRVYQHWRYHGNEVLQICFSKFEKGKRVSFVLSLIELLY